MARRFTSWIAVLLAVMVCSGMLTAPACSEDTAAVQPTVGTGSNQNTAPEKEEPSEPSAPEEMASSQPSQEEAESEPQPGDETISGVPAEVQAAVSPTMGDLTIDDTLPVSRCPQFQEGYARIIKDKTAVSQKKKPVLKGL